MTPWILIVIAAAGLVLSTYIHVKKSRKENIRCLFGEKCNVVLKSKYSFFLGLPTEALGIAYYFLMIVGLFFLIFTPSLVRPDGAIALLLAAALAFAFSVHQFGVQALVIHEWCSWCITSAVLNLLLVVLLPFALPYPFLDMLVQSKDFFVVFHIGAALIGVLTATISDMTFLKFLKDFRVSMRESEILEELSQVIWFSVALFLVSGLGLFLPHMSEYLSSPKFLAKMFVVAVIIINGIFLNLFVSPKLIEIPFNKKLEIKGKKAEELGQVRRLAFILGPISIISWYSAVVLGFLQDVPFGLWELLSIYGVLLFIGIAVGQLVERAIYSRK